MAGDDTRRAIHIVLAFDENYWAPAYATMRSVCLRTHRKADLVFHLLARGLTATQTADIERIPEEFGATLRWYDLDTSPAFAQHVDRLPSNRRFSSVVFARLMIDRLLDPAIERVLYLDSDTFVRAPIESLYETDLAGYPIAAVRDPYSDLIVGRRDLRANRDLFDIADPYFNSGVLLIDMAGWRQHDVFGKLEQVIADDNLGRLYYDQGVLNLAFKGRWLQLPRTWNFLDPRKVHAAIDPSIIHYTGTDRPWGLFSGAAFARTYRHLMTNEIFYRYMRHRWRRRLRRLIGRDNPR